VQTDEPAQPTEGSQAEKTAKCKPEFESFLPQMKDAMGKAKEEIIECKAEEENREVLEARWAVRSFKIHVFKTLPIRKHSD